MISKVMAQIEKAEAVDKPNVSADTSYIVKQNTVNPINIFF